MDEMTSNERKKSKVELGVASIAQALAALGGIALAIIGLSNVEPMLVLGVAAIVLGGGMLIGGGFVAARYTAIFPNADQTSAEELVGGGMALESLAGVAGVTLGILSLSSVVPYVLLPTTAIVFGGAMLMNAGSMERINALSTSYRGLFNLASLSDLLGGSAAIALGILALSYIDLWNLTLVAFLCIGGANLLSSFTIARKASTATIS